MVDADGLDWLGEAFECPPRTVFSIRQRFVQQGLEAALLRQQRAPESCAAAPWGPTGAAGADRLSPAPGRSRPALVRGPPNYRRRPGTPSRRSAAF